ncbi:MAG: DUF3025 domain-containing protein [Rhodocyclaceae bacterium]|nr:DUF3025 domain-containing protein [Rhodocyclaceae bacterium]
MSFELRRLPPGVQELFAPYRALIGESPLRVPPAPPAIDALLARRRPRTAEGRMLQVAGAGNDSALDYERRIRGAGALATRPGCWHDYFNALVWCVFPASKAVINQRHCEAAGGDRERGAVRDALTQFDECGALVVSSDPDLLDGLRGHRWEAVLWRQREHFMRHCRVLIVGHATLDALRRPFSGLCAKALYRQVPSHWLSADPVQRVCEADAWLADWLEGRGDMLTPRAFAPLPLLGLPQVTPDNACADYYRDSAQFRPRRAPGLGGLRCS